MSVTKEQLPELIAAAVQSAIAKNQLTDQELSAIAHRPITIGLIAVPAIERAGEFKAERVLATRPLGFQITKLEDLKDPSKIKAVE